MKSDARVLEQRVLLLAPSGRDAVLAAQSLERAGVPVLICHDSAALLSRIEEGAGAAVIAEEALSGGALGSLQDLLARQPPWSDLPLVIFTGRSASAQEHRRVLDAFEALGSVTILERPIHPLTMVSGVRAALRARTRQYTAREALRQREQEVRQRDQFLAMLGHELRNPLGALRNAAELVNRQGGTGSALARPLAIMNRQIGNLTRLVDDLLDVARVTSGKITIKAAPLDIVALVRRLGDETRRGARERRLTVEVDLPDVPLFVLGDAVRLEQVLQNLLGNAMKYTPAGGTIRIAVIPRDPVAIVVSDTGVGIAADVMSTIFEPFTQAPSTLDRSQGGMGLGLSVARALARLHDGDVTAASGGLGLGSTFTLTLPQHAAGRAAGPAPEPRPPNLPRTVLIVEDSEDNREALTMVLEFFGHRIYTAADGQEGIDRALQVRPEVALVDIGLPKVDGYQVARCLRAHFGAAIRLIAISGYGQPEDQARAMEHGFDAHLTKPVDSDTLQQLLAPSPAGA